MVKNGLKTNILVLLIIMSMIVSIISVYAGFEHTDPDDDVEYTFIENINAEGFEDIDPMDDPVTIDRGDDGSLQSITFQVNSTGGASARTYRTENFYSYST